MLIDPSNSDQIAELIEQVVPRNAVEPMGIYAFATEHPAADLARAVEYEVFTDVFNLTHQAMEAAYSPYESRSFFFCVIDHRRRRHAGSIRVIIPGREGEGSQTLNDLTRIWQISPSDLTYNGVRFPIEHCWDVATLAVAPQYRGRAAVFGLVSLSLYQALVRTGDACGIHYGVALLDETILHMSRRVFRGPFSVFDKLGPKEHLGSSATWPVYSDVLGWGAKLKKTDPSMFDLMFHGRGLEATMRPLDLKHAAEMAKKATETLRAENPPIIDLGALSRHGREPSTTLRS